MTSNPLRAAVPLAAALTACLLLAGCPHPKPGMQEEATGLLTDAKLKYDHRAYHQAAASCSAYIRTYPQSPVIGEAHYLRGLCRMHLNQVSAAADFAAAAEKAAENDVELRFKSRLARAHVAYERGSYVEAAELYAELLDAADWTLQPEILYRRGMALNVTGRRDEGVRVFRRLLDEYPDSAAADRLRKRVAEPDTGGRFAVQVGAFGKMANAQQAVARLSGAGYPALTEARRRGGRGLVAVLVGWFGTRAQADKARARLLALYPEAILIKR
jgi:DedD protein